MSLKNKTLTETKDAKGKNIKYISLDFLLGKKIPTWRISIKEKGEKDCNIYFSKDNCSTFDSPMDVASRVYKNMLKKEEYEQELPI